MFGGGVFGCSFVSPCDPIEVSPFIFRVFLAGKKPALKAFSEIQALLAQGKKREVKLLIRENAWPINSPVRAQLWPALCSQHQVGKSMLDGFYWDMVNQVTFYNSNDN